MPNRSALLIAGFLVCFGCGGEASKAGDTPEDAVSVRTPSPATPGERAGERASATRSEWIDPEPPDAQARAEEVVDASWNEDKTTRLVMRMTRLVDTRSGIEGFGTSLAARDTSVDERLDRLGAKVIGEEIVIRLPGSILFDFDRAEIRPDAERTLAEVAEVLQAYEDRRVRVEGHTDAIASDAYNLELSKRRAEAVCGWLGGRGVEAARLVAVGHGESRPVAENATAAGRQENRRVEVILERGG